MSPPDARREDLKNAVTDSLKELRDYTETLKFAIQQGEPAESIKDKRSIVVSKTFELKKASEHTFAHLYGEDASEILEAIYTITEASTALDRSDTAPTGYLIDSIQKEIPKHYGEVYETWIDLFEDDTEDLTPLYFIGGILEICEVVESHWANPERRSQDIEELEEDVVNLEKSIKRLLSFRFNRYRNY